MPACTALAFALCCAACASPPVVTVPQALRQCQAEPAVPPDDADDVALAEWVAGVAFAGRDCRSVLARVVELVGDP
jgi:hypothetical protein